jgi:hypothetical protein
VWDAETHRLWAEFMAALATARRQGARAFEERIAATRGTLAERTTPDPAGHDHATSPPGA